MFRLQTQRLIAQRSFSNSALTLQKLYVGNLNWTTSEDTLRTLFGKHGDLVDAFVVRDRLTGKSRGFGFVEFSDSAAAEQARAALDGADNEGRALKVNLAEEKPKPQY